ncbi:MAG: flagellin [Gammaproteobacteria bacterium]|jgi:flagellin|nr:flagellin [Gammaproteobacteria bacterium]
MTLSVNTNFASLSAQRNLSGSQGNLETSMERLTTGLRINSAKDDSAGLAISERMTAQINGLNQGVRNANDGISLTQVAEGALGEVTNNLQRIRELAVQSSNATNTQADRNALQAEVSQLLNEIDRVANKTSFNGVSLLDGSFTGANFQVGANNGDVVTVSSITDANVAALGSATQTTTTASEGAGLGSIAISALTGYGTATVAGNFLVAGTDIGVLGAASSAAERGGDLVEAINNISATTGVTATSDGTNISLISASTFAATGNGAVTAIGFNVAGNSNSLTFTAANNVGIANLSVAGYSGAQLALDQVDSALTAVNSARADLGAMQSRFDSIITTQQTTSDNLSASRGRIQDADFAAETAAMTKAQILQQSGIAMLSQANSAPQNVLALLQ